LNREALTSVPGTAIPSSPLMRVKMRILSAKIVLGNQ
jgi:hypothetical protein